MGEGRRKVAWGGVNRGRKDERIGTVERCKGERE